MRRKQGGARRARSVSRSDDATGTMSCQVTQTFLLVGSLIRAKTPISVQADSRGPLRETEGELAHLSLFPRPATGLLATGRLIARLRGALRQYSSACLRTATSGVNPGTVLLLRPLPVRLLRT